MNKLFSLEALNPSNLLTSNNSIAAVISACFGTFVSTVYGVEPNRKIAIAILLMLIIMDWISGIAASRKDGTYASQYGINVATLRTIYVLCFPALGNLLDVWLETPGPGIIFLGITGGLIYHYWQSMTANAYRAGWERWIPDRVIKHVEAEIKAKEVRAEKEKKKREGVQ
jgi:phage-related holin